MLRAVNRFPSSTFVASSIFGMFVLFRHRRTIAKADLLIIWSSYAGPLLAARRWLDGKVVVVRGSHHSRRQRELLDGARRPNRAQVILDEYEYRAADLVTVPTDAIARDPYFGRGAYVRANPYGFPASNVPSSPPRAAPTSTLRVLFVGAFSYRKGADRLRALFSTPQERFEFALVGPIEHGSEQLPDHWIPYGERRPDEVLDFMAQYHCLILPSREEGMARVGLEAMAMGLPIVVSPAAGLSEWCAGGGGVVVEDPENLPMWFAALEEVHDNFAVMEQSARRTAQSWTWLDYARRLIEDVPGLES